MSNRLYTVLILIASVLMLVAAVIALRSGARLQPSEDEPDEPIVEECFRAEPGGTADEPETRAEDSRPAKGRKSGKTLDERNKAAFEVAEMCHEVEEMVRRFRGTPEERQAVIEECEEGRELIRLIAELSVSSIENMSPEELEEERESFERDYRAQLDYLRTGRLQRMLKTPEEQEVIGGTIETVQDFLERIDEAMRSAGY